MVLDTTVTLVGGSWWPARPGPLAWVMLGLQAAACASLAVRRRAPLTVVAILAAYSLALALLISPAGLLTPANPGTVWAPFGTVLAAYAPFFYQPNRRLAIAAVVVLSVIVARPWQPSVTVITVAILRTAAGPLLAMYFDARRRLVQALTERAERAERERHLLAEQARAEERARLAGEMHDVVTHRVSLMVLQAGALRMTAADDATRQAAEELRAAGCQALDELRDLVGILRTMRYAVRPTTGEASAGSPSSASSAGVPTPVDSATSAARPGVDGVASSSSAVRRMPTRSRSSSSAWQPAARSSSAARRVASSAAVMRSAPACSTIRLTRCVTTSCISPARRARSSVRACSASRLCSRSARSARSVKAATSRRRASRYMATSGPAAVRMIATVMIVIDACQGRATMIVSTAMATIASRRFGW